MAVKQVHYTTKLPPQPTPRFQTISRCPILGEHFNYTPNFWNRYNAKGLSKVLSGGKVVRDYGVCIWNDETGKLDYYIGITKDDANGDLRETHTLRINGGLYALFATPPAKHSDFVNTIHKTWNYIFNIWLPQSEYRFAGGYQFECYVEASRIYSEDICIPIIKNEGEAL
jgi:AraC family transcriptional regulator